MCFFRKRRERKRRLKEEEALKQQEVEQKVVKEEPKVVETPKVKEEPKVEVQKVKEEPKPEEVSEKNNNTQTPRYHVSQNKDAKSPHYKKWRVRLSGSKKTIKYHDTQAEAIKHAEDLAEKNNTSVVIHKLDGSIRKQNYND